MGARPKIAIFASGNGSNLQAILDQQAEGQIPADIRVILSDKKKAFALERATKAGVEALHISPKSFPSREAYDQSLIELLRERQVDWVVLAGFMRILSSPFVKAFAGRILNIHPALLPKYPGTHSIERAYQDQQREVGVTVHFVDEGVDTGPVILQEAIPVREGESLDELTERVHKVEHRLYPEAIRKVLAGNESSSELENS